MEDAIRIYHIIPTAPLHIGLEGIGQERLDRLFRSDALWGALVQCRHLLYHDDWENLINDDSFLVSSCFPFIAGKRFYPVPHGAFDRVMMGIRGSELKKWKKIKYVSENLFQNIISGTFNATDSRLCGEYVCSEKIDEGFGVKEYEVPRIGIDPVSGTAQEGAFFYCVNAHFPENSGLFFLARFRGIDAQKHFEGSLRLLADCGIGGDRSIGRGTFRFTCEQCTLTLPDNPDAHVGLSLYHPTEKEVQSGLLDRAYYSLVKRYGYAAGLGARSLRRRNVLMLEEGAVFFDSQPPVGDIPVVLQKNEGGSPFDVFRFGKAFTLPVKGGCFEQHT